MLLYNEAINSKYSPPCESALGVASSPEFFLQITRSRISYLGKTALLIY